MSVKKSKRNKVLAVKMLKLAQDILSAPADAEIDPEEMKISQLKKEIFQSIKQIPINKSDRLRKLLPDVGVINIKTMKVSDFMELFVKMLRAKAGK